MNQIKIRNIILSFFSLRLVSYNRNVEIERLNEEDELWLELENSLNLQDILNWRIKMREFAWGKNIDFRSANQDWSIQEEIYHKSFVNQFLGFSLFVIINDDDAFEEFINNISDQKEYLEKYVENINNNEKIREDVFLELNLDYNLNQEKVNEELVSKLASEICEEFNIKSISFNYSIPEIDVLKYLFLLAYSFSAFSKILKNKNIGFNELSLCFENKGIDVSCYSLSNKTIYLSLKDLGSFSHEWFHFVDHRLMNYFPQFDDNNILFSNLSSESINKENFKTLILKINEKFNYKEKDIIKSIYSIKLVLKSLPDIFKRFIRKHPKNKKIFNQLLTEIDFFIFESEKIINNKKQMLTSWNNINKVVERKMEELPQNKEEIKQTWKKYSSFIEKMCFNEYLLPKKPMWCIYSMLFDTVNNKNYFYNKEEMLARSFEIYIRSKLGKKTWLSNKKEYGLIYPKEKELEEEVKWWDNNIHLFLIDDK